MKKTFATIGALSVAFAGLALPMAVSAAPISAMSVTGTNITANSAELSTAVTPTVNFTTSTAINTDSQTMTLTLNGMVVAAGETLEATDLTLTCDVGGADTNIPLEAAPGAAATDADVTITNGAAGNADPVISIVWDASTVACPAAATTLAVAASQLESEATAGNYGIFISTSFDNGAFFFYVANENDVVIRAEVDNVLTFVITEADGTTAKPNVDGLAVGPNLCDLGLLVAGAAPSTCDYRLVVSTNALSGYYISVQVDDDLNNADDSEFLDTTATGSAPVAGTEGYNILFATGTPTTGTATACDGTTVAGACTASGVDFSDATGTAFEGAGLAAASVVMIDVDGPNSPTIATNSALVTHRAAADNGTPAGLYNQTATYTVNARY